MGLWLSPQVRAVRVESDVVFLDIADEAYLCVVGAGEHLRLLADGRVAANPEEAAVDLVEAGLLSRQPDGALRVAPPKVRRGLETAPGPWMIGDLASAVAANLKAYRAVENVAFSDLFDLVDPLAASAFEPPSAELLASAARFDCLAPWLPRAGRCLMRSLQQRLHLARLGHRVAWVFGVRTWPFEAHCWLQAGDVVLDDTPDHAGSFTPIMAV